MERERAVAQDEMQNRPEIEKVEQALARMVEVQALPLEDEARKQAELEEMVLRERLLRLKNGNASESERADAISLRSLAHASPSPSQSAPVVVSWPKGLDPSYQDELLKIFGMIDDDSNGVMDFSELLDLGKGVSASFTAEKCATLLGRMDNDHDGTVTQSEFLGFIGNMMEGHSKASNDKGMVQIRKSAEAHVIRKHAVVRQRLEAETVGLHEQLRSLQEKLSEAENAALREATARGFEQATAKRHFDTLEAEAAGLREQLHALQEEARGSERQLETFRERCKLLEEQKKAEADAAEQRRTGEAAEIQKQAEQEKSGLHEQLRSLQEKLSEVEKAALCEQAAAQGHSGTLEAEAAVLRQQLHALQEEASGSERQLETFRERCKLLAEQKMVEITALHGQVEAQAALQKQQSEAALQKQQEVESKLEAAWKFSKLQGKGAEALEKEVAGLREELQTLREKASGEEKVALHLSTQMSTHICTHGHEKRPHICLHA